MGECAAEESENWMSLKLGYDLTIEQTQKMIMTPELIQAIKILQFNIQELDAYVQEEILTNPVLETLPDEEPEGEPGREQRQEEPLDWKEHIRNAAYEQDGTDPPISSSATSAPM